MSAIRNKFKKIEITRTNQGGTWRTWKQNLSGILGTSGLNGLLGVNLSVDRDVDLVLDTDTFPSDLKFKNKTEKPVAAFLSGNAGKYGQLVGAAGTIISAGANIASTVANLGQDTPAAVFNPWFKNTPAYDADKLEPPSFSYTFNFTMGQYGLWNAQKEVAIPILNLIAPTLPRELNSGFTTPAFPTSLGLFTSILNGVLTNNGWERISTAASGIQNINLSNVRNAWGSLTRGEGNIGSNLISLASEGAQIGVDILEVITQVISAILQEGYRDYTYSVKFGDFITFNNMLITGSACSFSSETDQYGIPVSGSCTLDFEGIVPVALKTDGVTPTLTLGGLR